MTQAIGITLVISWIHQWMLESNRNHTTQCTMRTKTIQKTAIWIERSVFTNRIDCS